MSDAQRVLKSLARIRSYPDRGEELWRRVIEIEARQTALSRGQLLIRKDGKPSRLVPALLGGSPPDRRWYMGARAPAGGEVSMSGWVRIVTKSTFTWSEADRARYLREIARYLHRST